MACGVLTAFNKVKMICRRLACTAWMPDFFPFRKNSSSPLCGYSYQTTDQKEDLAFVTKGIQGVGVLDYVCGWYLKAAQYVSGSQLGEASRDRKEFADVDFTDANTAASKAKTRKNLLTLP